ncbi:MAG: hypothetical protein RI884_361 [Pseudomonadota bacterium]|jgi:hypothetical protein
MKELSPPAPRRLRHTRQVEMKGYEREDGLWDIEGQLSDVRTYELSAIRARGARPREAGDPIHLMTLRLTVNDQFVIVGVEVVSHQVPYEECGQIGPAYGQLVGMKIEAGFNQAVKARFRGALGCTHLTELLGPLATATFQTIRPALDLRREGRGEPPADDGPRPPLLDSCHGLRRGGQAAIVRWGPIGR